MDALLSRAEQRARGAVARNLSMVAMRMRSLIGGAAVQVGDGQVMVSGRGVAKRWLSEPDVRFLSRGLK
jgi:hypothetical protein